MSYETWAKEYYPINAEDVPKSEALKHSLQKWIGLRKTNLERHGVRLLYQCIYEGNDLKLMIAASSCALCVHYLASTKCRECPLFAVRNAPCDRPVLDSP